MTREQKIDVLVDHKELIPVAPELYEDMGGHVIHESDKVIDMYYAEFVKRYQDYEKGDEDDDAC